MIVVDASAMVEALVGKDVDSALFDALAGEVHAPHLLDIEVLSVLRGLSLAGKLDVADAERARRAFFEFSIARYEVAPLSQRVWQLRHQFTAYDACYVALAEGLGAPLVTCDAKLRSGAHRAEIRLAARRD
ncbi:type II toxin-antitoxin system VapC family toxin [Demequina pelophila]|uniref:type II toxin-antitoxin system VapC family toxin n=1 Tax=Demequina pelophila TaxID=1638984 RepID=UPI000782DAEB|nr:type II toxin-antitoxin system VapC family toxin [Demequina pelophila]